jgi:hypothetical protein
MQSRSLAVVDVHADAASAFRSMLDILDGRTHCRWKLVDSVDDAQVIVAGFSGGRSGLGDWRRSDKHVVAIVESSDVRPQTPYVLTHPFRVMQVLTILNEIADEGVSAPACQDPPPASSAEWEFADSVRALLGKPTQSAWYRATSTDRQEVLVAAAHLGYAAAPATLDRVRRGTIRFSALAPIRLQNVPPQYERRPTAELLWHNAYHASTQLAPWLDPSGGFRTRRWPDFGVIPATRPRLQLLAALSRRESRRTELVALGHASAEEVDRVLNALSLCDLLDSDRSAISPPARHATAAAPGFLRTLIGGLRQRLGWG